MVSVRCDWFASETYKSTYGSLNPFQSAEVRLRAFGTCTVSRNFSAIASCRAIHCHCVERLTGEKGTRLSMAAYAKQRN